MVAIGWIWNIFLKIHPLSSFMIKKQGGTWVPRKLQDGFERNLEHGRQNWFLNVGSQLFVFGMYMTSGTPSDSFYPSSASLSWKFRMKMVYSYFPRFTYRKWLIYKILFNYIFIWNTKDHILNRLNHFSTIVKKALDKSGTWKTQY